MNTTRKIKISKLLISANCLTLLLMCSSLSSCGSVPPILKENICMVTDSGDITDESFNQNSWEGCVAFEEYCKEIGLDVNVKYIKPTASDLASLVEAIELGIDQGNGVIILPGYIFADAIKDVAPRYPEVKIISLDTDASSFGEGYELPKNVYCCIYQDEIAGFMAGYAAAAEGFTNLGFLGGLPVAAVKRYGFGYCQGIDYYVYTTKTEKKYNIRYVYGNQFFGDSDIKARMDTWYQGRQDPTQVVFCCGGGIYTSACEAALSAKEGEYVPKVIGVDVDQGPLINEKYASHMCITSAMKGLSATVFTCLYSYVIENIWESEYKKLSFDKNFLVEKDPTQNFIQLSPSSFGKKEGYDKELNVFTYDDYINLAVQLCKANNGEKILDPELINYMKVDISKDNPSIRQSDKVSFENQGFIK